MEYFKLIIRRFSRNRVYTIINIGGLAIALTAALLIYSHVVKEWQTDRFHENGKTIYRLTLKSSYAQNWSSYTSAPMGPYTMEAYPGVKNFVRVLQTDDHIVRRVTDTEFSNHIRCIYTDRQFFDMFTFPLLAGTVRGNDSDWVVVSRSFANRFWSDKSPVGELLVLKNLWEVDDKGKEFRIVAVMEDFPVASTLQADIVADFSNMEKKQYNSWGMYGINTYFQLGGNAALEPIEKGIPRIVENNYHWIKASEFVVKLQPIEDIYFGSAHIQEDIPHGSKRLNSILCGITLLILILASCNYIMIKISGFNKNAASLAVQRCFGAGNRYLYRQIMGETGFHLATALILAVVLTLFLHPFFVQILALKSPYTFHFSIGEATVFITLLVLFAICIASVLFFYIFQRLDRKGIKANLVSFGSKWEVKKILSLTQMCIFCTLLCCSIVLIRQMDFVKERQLGFDSGHVVQLQWLDNRVNMETLKSELKNHPDVVAVSNGFSLPLIGDNPGTIFSEDHPGQGIEAYMIHGDADFLNTYQIKLSEGRGIRKDSYPAEREDFFTVRSDVCAEVVVNRKFAEQLNVENPLGTILKDHSRKMKIVGITEDFHFLPLYEATQPMYIIYDVPFLTSSVLIRYREGKRQEVMDYLKRKYDEQFEGAVFLSREYNFSELYNKDVAVVKLINVFTFIAIFIGSMGIFAFSMFMAESRRKEIALRKVNGAGEWQIIGLLNRNFVMRVLLACGIGLPIADYMMKKWLESFAYKVELNIEIYLLVIMISVVLVLTIITWQIWKAATVNPVDVLKQD